MSDQQVGEARARRGGAGGIGADRLERLGTLSREAIDERDERRRWAAPGGAHDRLVRRFKTFLPIIAGVLAAFLAIAPFTSVTEVSFVLDKNKVDMASERLKVVEAYYRGDDALGRPFSLRAGSAMQRSSRDPVVQIADMEARLQLDDSPALLTAQRGSYNLTNEQVMVDGPVVFETANGYRLTTRDVLIDLPSRSARSRGAVDGRMPVGTFSADQLKADLAARTVTLTGRARLRIDQNGLKGS
jgi:lipopolysaccharide export system protein LptC